MEETIKNILERVDELRADINELSREEMEKYGSIALEHIGDYPLYGATSNISYDEAILIDVVLGEDPFVDEEEE